MAKTAICKICNEEHRDIVSHIKKHNMKKAEYLNLFPGSDMYSDDLMLKRNELGKKAAEAMHRKLKEDNYKTRNHKRHKTMSKNGGFEKIGSFHRERFKDPEVKRIHLETRKNSESKRKESYTKMVEKFGKEKWSKIHSDRAKEQAKNRSPKKWKNIIDAIQKSSKKGSKIERDFFEALKTKYPNKEWKLHDRIYTGDPFGKTGYRQIDITCPTDAIYIEWNGFVHYLDSWRNPNEDAIFESKKQAVVARGGRLLVIKDYQNSMTIEKAMAAFSIFLASSDNYFLFA